MSQDTTIDVNNITFDVETEELNDIEYLEIMTIDQIIKENPTFIAFSQEDIFNELFNMFKNKNKTNGYIDLYYNIINKRTKKLDITNYIVHGDVEKKNYENENIKDLINTINKYNKLSYNNSQNEKNKLSYVLKYDEDNPKLRFKAEQKTYIELRKDNIILKYAVFKNDNTNLPVNSIYYLLPKSSVYDFLYLKILSDYNIEEKINEIESTGYTSIEKILNDVKPEINLTKLKDDFLLDYSHLEAFYDKYNISFNEIDVEELNKLKELLQKYTSNVKSDKPIYKTIKNKPLNTNTSKFSYYEKLKDISKIIENTLNASNKYEPLYDKLVEERTNLPPALLYNNIYDIIEAINNKTISLEDIKDNIKNIKKSLIIDHSIETIRKFKELDKDEIDKLLNSFEERFNLIKDSISEENDIVFVDYVKELLEIKLANNTDNYEGAPVNLKKIDFEDNMDDDGNKIFDIGTILNTNKDDISKYWKNFKYKNDIGFVESLEIVLKFIDKIRDKANLFINYDLLCSELYKKYSNISTKANIIKSNFDKNYPNSTINDFARITYNKIIAKSDKNINDQIYIALIKANKEYSAVLIKMIYSSIMWWSIQIQNDIIDEQFMFDNITLYDICLIDWSLFGIPLVKRSTVKKDTGVLKYLICITNRLFEELQSNNTNDHFNIDSKDIDGLLSNIEKEFKDELTELRNRYEKMGKKEEKNRFNEAYSILKKKIDKTIAEKININQAHNRLLNNYVDSLLFLPGYKYSQIHKFLLGCCLQKIDDNFKPDKYLSTKANLLILKKSFSENRATNKPRTALHLLQHIDDDIEEKYIEKIQLEEIRTNITENDINSYKDWIDYMLLNPNPLLPQNILNEMKTNTRMLNQHIQKYIELLTKTANISDNVAANNNLKNIFNDIENIKYKEVLLILKKILYTSRTTFNSDNSLKLLNVSIDTINDIINKITILNGTINEYSKSDILRIRHFIIARALCLPTNPEDAIGGKLKTTIAYENNFIKTISSEIYMKVLNYLTNAKMPTVEENVAFINKIREENKNKTLKVMNTKTEEERNVISQIKKIISDKDKDKYLKEANLHNIPEEKENDVNNDVKDDDDYYEQSGESDFKIDSVDADVDDDILDKDDYGFISS